MFFIPDIVETSPSGKKGKHKDKSEPAPIKEPEVLKDAQGKTLLDGSVLQSAKEVIPSILAAVAKDTEAAKSASILAARDGRKSVSGASGSKNDDMSEDYEDLEKYRDGWVQSSADKMTLAEVHLLLGSPDKLVLEYEWVDVAPPSREIVQMNTNITNMLRRLVHLATTEFTDFSKVKPVSNCQSQNMI